MTISFHFPNNFNVWIDGLHGMKNFRGCYRYQLPMIENSQHYEKLWEMDWIYSRFDDFSVTIINEDDWKLTETSVSKFSLHLNLVLLSNKQEAMIKWVIPQKRKPSILTNISQLFYRIHQSPCNVELIHNFQLNENYFQTVSPFYFMTFGLNFCPIAKNFWSLSWVNKTVMHLRKKVNVTFIIITSLQRDNDIRGINGRFPVVNR